ncbi:MAG: serine/threonine protein kinase [Bacteroidetes bacterium GWF2_38_335]|nr:MAG: serine/threonine protein kinase [Bacteroidetes bacterium GWF2_38_335]OFY77151.1 MAG: serine/threonine protein kinase [Bacteroidetes bacterium RIFOXYA12_FULL_38_20]HBS85043.1 ATP-binding protein [Bacteroidales bacterium]
MKSEFNFPSKIENVSYVEKLVDDLCGKYELSSEIYGNMMVAVVEAVNNAILHGNKLDPEKLVYVAYSIDGDYLTFFIKDEGKGFEFDEIPDPTLPENIEKPHGRGIFLMKHLVDEIKFNHHGAEVELKFKIK